MQRSCIISTWCGCRRGKRERNATCPLERLPVPQASEPHDAPIWVALDQAHPGHALTTQAIANIVEAHLGTSKAHTTRHTFAHSMEAVGAKVSDIQARLGHSSLHTTGMYLAALKSAYNPQAEALADLFGAEEE